MPPHSFARAATSSTGRRYPPVTSLDGSTPTRRLIEPTTGGYAIAAACLRAGWIGVDLFFVLSGFLITGILLESRCDSPHFFLLDHGLYWNSPRVQAVGFTVVALLWGTVLTGALVQPTWPVLARVLSASWLQTVGKYSYAIYVLHFPMNFWARKHLALLPFTNLVLRQVSYAAVMAVASMGAALLSWHLLEKPCLDLKSYFPR